MNYENTKNELEKNFKESEFINMNLKKKCLGLEKSVIMKDTEIHEMLEDIEKLREVCKEYKIFETKTRELESDALNKSIEVNTLLKQMNDLQAINRKQSDFEFKSKELEFELTSKEHIIDEH